MDVALNRYGQELLTLYPSELRSELEEALDELVLDGIAVAREVLAAEADGVSFADAARSGRYPTMARVHYGLLDVLQLELAPDDRGAIERVLARAGQVDLDALRRRWFVVAADEPDTLSGALMRYLLYQAVRLNVWVLTWRDGAPLEAAGSLRRLDDEAEARLRARLTMDEMQDPAVRPLQVLIADAFTTLDAIWSARRDELARERPEVVRLFHGLTQAAAVARDLGAADAALVRNELEGAIGGEQLESRPLSERQPLALRSQNGTDQRRRRLLARLSEGDTPEPRGKRLIDLIVDGERAR